MITPKIKALFQFIDYLHNNIEYFNQYKALINELVLLHEERMLIKPMSNYREKLKLDEVLEHWLPNYKKLQNNTANLISAKAIELNLGNFDDELFLFTSEIGDEIDQLKRNFSKDDLSEIFTRKSQYLEFRKNDYCDFFTLFLFFEELDMNTKVLFGFFKEPSDPNEFEAFETKVVQIDKKEKGGKLLTKHIEQNPFDPQLQKGLKELIKSNKEAFNIIRQTEKLIDEDLSFEQQTNIEPLPPQPNAKQSSELPEKLELLFESIAKYKKVMEILVSKKLIHSNTYIWKDEKNGNKGYLVALIKDLHGKKYYKDNTRPTIKQIKAICDNTFGWKVGIDTIKHTKATDFDFSFIPPASTLD
jgi:hypothetical protein